MKYILFIFVSVLVIVSCIDDKTNLDYREINEYENWKINGINNAYSLFPGETITLTPEVRLSIDSINPDVSYSWLLDGKEVSTEASYTFTEENYGDYELIFNAIDNKTGVAFPERTRISVMPLYKLGWLFLGRTASGASRLDILVSKRLVISYFDEDGYSRTRDSLLMVQFDKGVGEQLGNGPIKLVEEYPYGSYSAEIPSEVMVLQESGPVELGGNTLAYTGQAFEEFMGEVPANLVVRDAALSRNSKWLLAEDGLLYYSVANVLSDLHSGRYNDDPAFNGMKFQSLIPVFKGDDTYYLEVTPAVDVDGTMWAFYDYAKREDNNVIDPENQVGRKLEIVNKGNQFDMSLFHKFKGKRIKDCFVRSDDYLLSLLELENGTCVWHRYMFDVDGYDKGADDISLTESKVGEFADPSMFTNFKDAAYEPGYYDGFSWLFIASGNQLYGCQMDWNVNRKQTSEHFFTAAADIQAVKTRYIEERDYLLVGVLTVDGTFEVLEVKLTDEEKFSYKSVYKENLKTLDPEMMEIIDFIPKWGSGYNQYYGTSM